MLERTTGMRGFDRLNGDAAEYGEDNCIINEAISGSGGSTLPDGAPIMFFLEATLRGPAATDVIRLN